MIKNQYLMNELLLAYKEVSERHNERVQLDDYPTKYDKESYDAKVGAMSHVINLVAIYNEENTTGDVSVIVDSELKHAKDRLHKLTIRASDDKDVPYSRIVIDTRRHEGFDLMAMIVRKHVWKKYESEVMSV